MARSGGGAAEEVPRRDSVLWKLAWLFNNCELSMRCETASPLDRSIACVEAGCEDLCPMISFPAGATDQMRRMQMSAK